MKQLILVAFSGVLACGCAESTGDSGAGSSNGGGDSASTGGSATGGSATGGSASGTGGDTTGASGGAATSAGGTSSSGTWDAGAGGWPVADLPAASASVVYLSDLTEKGSVAFDNFGSPARPGNVIGKDQSLSGNRLVIDGVEYPKGIECRAFTQVWYTLNGKYSRFVAETGLDYLENSTRTGFEVKLDGALVYDTGNIDKSDVKHIDIDVRGVNEMEVFTRTDNYNSVDEDFGIWGGARLLE